MRKSGHGKIMAVSEFGGLWMGHITRFYCTCVIISCIKLDNRLVYRVLGLGLKDR